MNGSVSNRVPHPLYKERYQATKRRLGRQRGPKVAQTKWRFGARFAWWTTCNAAGADWTARYWPCWTDSA